MIKILKVAYFTQRWVRVTTWISLLLGSLIYFRLTGGFPPHGWQVLARGLASMSALWSSHGPSVLLPLLVLCIYSLLLLLIWLFFIGAMLWAAFQQWNYLRTWRHVERVARTVQHDDSYMTQQAAAEWQPNRQRDEGMDVHYSSTPSPSMIPENMGKQVWGTDTRESFLPVSVGERTDAHQGPPPPTTHAPVPTMYETAGMAHMRNDGWGTDAHQGPPPPNHSCPRPYDVRNRGNNGGWGGHSRDGGCGEAGGGPWWASVLPHRACRRGS